MSGPTERDDVVAAVLLAIQAWLLAARAAWRAALVVLHALMDVFKVPLRSPHGPFHAWNKVPSRQAAARAEQNSAQQEADEPSTPPPTEAAPLQAPAGDGAGAQAPPGPAAKCAAATEPQPPGTPGPAKPGAGRASPAKARPSPPQAAPRPKEAAALRLGPGCAVEEGGARRSDSSDEGEGGSEEDYSDARADADLSAPAGLAVPAAGALRADLDVA